MEWTPGPRKNIEDRRFEQPAIRRPSPVGALLAGLPTTATEADLYKQALQARDAYRQGGATPAGAPGQVLEERRAAAYTPYAGTSIREIDSLLADLQRRRAALVKPKK
jgi:hypothetical protein